MNIHCSPDMVNIARHWSDDFCAIHPEIKINLVSVSENELVDLSLSGNELCFISDNYTKLFDKKSSIMVIGRDILIPVINMNNPFLDKIKLQGVSINNLQNLVNTSGSLSWSSLVENSNVAPINFYSIKKALIENEAARFSGININPANGIEVRTAEELIKNIQNDPYALGFCKLSDIVNIDNQDFASNIMLLSIDKNGNGKMDYFENIYGSLNDFVRGVWIGKYPKSLINNFYAITTSTTSKNENEIAFLKWILSDGQQILVQNGYSELAINERQSKIESLTLNEKNIEPEQNQYALLKVGLFIVIILMIGGVTLFVIASKKRKRQNVLASAQNQISGLLSVNKLVSPNGLYYDKTHTWAFMEKDGIVRVGIDDFMQHITGTFTRIKMKNPGEFVKKNDHLLSLVQDGKQLNIYAPFSGKIVDINEYLITEPTRLNLSPYNDGWVYRIEPSNWLREIQFLQMVGTYREWMKNEIIRLKDFIAVIVNGKSMEYGFVTYQDGGELNDHILKDLGPEVWEDFQKQFIDTSVMR